MGITNIYCSPEKIIIKSFYTLRHKSLGTLGKAEIITCKSDLQIHAISRYAGIYILRMRNSVYISTRKHIELINSRMLLCQACNTTNTIATHLCLRAIGVEHSHTKHAISLNQKQHSICSDRATSVADKACKIRKVNTVKIVLYGIYHHELIARAVAFDIVKFHSIQCIIVQK